MTTISNQNVQTPPVNQPPTEKTSTASEGGTEGSKFHETFESNIERTNGGRRRHRGRGKFRLFGPGGLFGKKDPDAIKEALARREDRKAERAEQALGGMAYVFNPLLLMFAALRRPPEPPEPETEDVAKKTPPVGDQPPPAGDLSMDPAVDGENVAVADPNAPPSSPDGGPAPEVEAKAADGADEPAAPPKADGDPARSEAAQPSLADGLISLDAAGRTDMITASNDAELQKLKDALVAAKADAVTAYNDAIKTGDATMTENAHESLADIQAQIAAVESEFQAREQEAA